MTFPVAKSHHLTVLSSEPDKAVLPSGENATELTSLECPSKVLMTFPVAKSHHFTVSS